MATQSLSRSSFLTPRKYNSMLAGNAAFDPSSDFLIQEQILATTATTVTFSAIPSTYKHLQIRIDARTDRGAGGDQIYMTVNGDSAANYAAHTLTGNGSTVTSNSYTSSTPINTYVAWTTAASNPASVFAPSIIDILDYANTSKYKTVRSLTGNQDTTPRIILISNLWQNTAAITSVSLAPVTGPNFIAGSRFSLYGSLG